MTSIRGAFNQTGILNGRVTTMMMTDHGKTVETKTPKRDLVEATGIGDIPTGIEDVVEVDVVDEVVEEVEMIEVVEAAGVVGGRRTIGTRTCSLGLGLGPFANVGLVEFPWLQPPKQIPSLRFNPLQIPQVPQMVWLPLKVRLTTLAIIWPS